MTKEVGSACQWVAGFLHDHSEALLLFGLAMAVTMPEKLPWPFCLIVPLEWCWEWLRKGLVTFVSLRGPAQHAEAVVQQSTERRAVTEPSGRKVETTSTKETIGSSTGKPNNNGSLQEKES